MLVVVVVVVVVEVHFDYPHYEKNPAAVFSSRNLPHTVNRDKAHKFFDDREV